MFIDPLYIIFSLPALAIGLFASFLVNSTFRKYSGILNSKGMTGIDIVHTIAKSKGYPIQFEEGTHNDLDNHYNPFTSTVALSSEVSRTPSIAAVAIAAHEMGHVSQHHEKSLGITLRSFIAPIVNISTNIGYFFLILGLILTIPGLAWLGIILFSSATVFSVLTLPVEFGASSKALKFIKEYSFLDSVELQGAKSVLMAAAFTYVASTIQSLSTLLYFVLRVRGTSRER